MNMTQLLDDVKEPLKHFIEPFPSNELFERVDLQKCSFPSLRGHALFFFLTLSCAQLHFPLFLKVP